MPRTSKKCNKRRHSKASLAQFFLPGSLFAGAVERSVWLPGERRLFRFLLPPAEINVTIIAWLLKGNKTTLMDLVRLGCSPPPLPPICKHRLPWTCCKRLRPPPSAEVGKMTTFYLWPIPLPSTQQVDDLAYLLKKGRVERSMLSAFDLWKDRGRRHDLSLLE
jgi:hypothetical protein